MTSPSIPQNDSTDSPIKDQPSLGGAQSTSADRQRLDDDRRFWTLAAVESAVEGIITIDAMGTIEYVNASSQKMFGYTEEELLGHTINTLMPSPYKEEHDGYLQHYCDTGEKKIIGIGREVVGKRKDGSIFPIHLAVSEVPMSSRRIFTGFIYDITDRKHNEEEKDRLLQELDKRNREINCLYRIGETMRPSDLAASAFHETANIIHTSVSHPALRGTRLTIDDKRYDNESFLETSWALTSDIVASGRKRGEAAVFFEGNAAALQEDPQLQGERNLLEAIARFISEAVERSEAEAKVIQASKLASIGELAAGVGHEINNPVNGIINCADIILKECEVDSTVHKFGSLIRSEADRIAVIVHNLLAFSRQDKGQHSAAQFADIIDSILSLCNKKLQRSHIKLEVDVPKTLPRMYCRSEQLQQVFMNLVINSMHALDEHYPGLHSNKVLSITAAERTVSDQAFIRVTIQDNGVGISEADRQRMFDPFFTTKGRDKGTGLGLSISDGIVKNHGGTIECESELGKFTRFHVTLPLSSDEVTITQRSNDALQEDRSKDNESQ